MTEAPNFTLLPLGAIIQRFSVDGVNIVQGFPTAGDYEAHNAPYFGETIGRVGNRVSGAKINNLNGRSYPLVANNGPNTLHGGVKGWGKRVWEGPIKDTRDGKDATLFKRISDDGEEGFPGAVEAKIWYTGGVEKDGSGKDVSVLEMEYEVKMVGDPAKEPGINETAVSVTNHR
jgi:aldose 1-epimerase